MPACSYVIIFGHLQSMKSYIQTKGRARAASSKFYLFRDSVQQGKKTKSLDLTSAQKGEHVLQKCKNRIKPIKTSLPIKVEKSKTMCDPCQSLHDQGAQISIPCSSCEELLLRAGEYDANMAHVNLQTGKSLLNSYLQHVSKHDKSILREMSEIYHDYHLVLPSHINPSVRIVTLPDFMRVRKKADRHKSLAFLACVRLHQLKVLSDNLKPLSASNLPRLIDDIVPILEPRKKKQESTKSFCESNRSFWLYRIFQSGHTFSLHDSHVNPDRTCLGILMNKKFTEIPNFRYEGVNDFGVVDCSLDKCSEIKLNEEEEKVCEQFFIIIIHTRWLRKSNIKDITMKESLIKSNIFHQAYVLCFVKKDGSIDFEKMRKVVSDYSRTLQEKINAVQRETPALPRVWTATYDTRRSYLVFGPSGLSSGAKFPYGKGGYKTYADYMRRHHDCDIEDDSPLYLAQFCWKRPRRPTMTNRKGVKRCHEELDPPSLALEEGEKEVLQGLRPLLL